MSAEDNTKSETPHILVVDDEESIRISLSEALSSEEMRVSTAIGGDECFAVMQGDDVDLVLLDQRLSATQENGLDVLKRIKEEYPETIVIMMTAYGKFESAVEATRLGCFQYIAKPLDLHQLNLLIRNALSTMALTREVRQLRAQQRKEFAVDEVFGSSEQIRQLLEKVKKVARSRTATVLLRGETGSGKGLIAREIHNHSDVAAGPFVDVNCSAVAENLLEDELFGHDKGAFTDAKTSREGVFELANGGTLFLDEIAEMSTRLQAKLLKILELKTFRRVGGTAPIRVEVRIIAATNRDLFEEVEAGRFREDLYYRLTVIPIFVPPLRERRDDIAHLVKTFLDHYRREIGRQVNGLSDAAMEMLCAYSWPGNVRELKNLIEQVVLMGSGDTISIDDLPEHVRLNRGGPRTGGRGVDLFQPGRIPTLDEVAKVAIEHCLNQVGWNKTRAAERLGITRQTLRSKIKEYGIEQPEATQPVS
ncbi:sigma-54-dependent transcriptional regulator [Candidatus Eisenbacteria bacterium]|uniref:Sigma-54-dependent transcriptional regulator n=1 Tax=Eiseniibacteriota bacterium TaxID=2212470 RepID=A0ABV6YKI3_UNCEI